MIRVIKLTCLSPTGIFTEYDGSAVFGPPTSTTEFEASGDESREALTPNQWPFLPENRERNLHFPKAAKRERVGKRRGLVERRNLEGWEWRCSVAGPWRVLLGHDSIFLFLSLLQFSILGASCCCCCFRWERELSDECGREEQRRKRKSTVIRFWYLVHMRGCGFWALSWIFLPTPTPFAPHTRISNFCVKRLKCPSHRNPPQHFSPHCSSEPLPHNFCALAELPQFCAPKISVKVKEKIFFSVFFLLIFLG